ncbi:hypothetical protein B2G71_05065 [Novosphingobium sp. PC22D]|uniref:Ig-like domain-containing protein n=1 Tax=Novosphingobium sp. PC22D TaxID=1962403 RepID=UPI000BF0D129|nr:Ig-like domain-containing protein [Novosphingobium sp. PC22D]PEQ13693.1 hypothetical protein B2G71_05065 [Novosphingobium sp. PC22D]
MLIKVTASDGGYSTSDIFEFEVGEVNDSPRGQDDSVETLAGMTLDIPVANLLANGLDIEGSPLQIIAVGNAAQGSVSLQNGTVTFVPEEGFIGMASFTHNVGDEFSFDKATVTVNVLDPDGGNAAPVFSPDSGSFATLAGTGAAFTVAATDADGDALSYSAGEAVHGTLTDTGNGRFVYTPENGFVGTDSFHVTVSDGNGGSDTFAAIFDVVASDPSGGEWRLITHSGWIGEIGGSGDVFGTTGFEDVTVLDLAGRISFDPSFNRGGDVVRLPGDASEWSASISGSSVSLFDGDTEVIIPAVPTGLTLVFADGPRILEIEESDNVVVIGDQVIDQTLTILTAEAQDVPVPVDGIGADSSAQLVMNEGGAASVGGHVSVFGTADGSETITITSGEIVFDPSFNRGGDTILVDGSAGDFSAVQDGSNVIISSINLAFVVPVGLGATTIGFDEGADLRELQIVDGTIHFGDQTLGIVPLEVAPFA